VADSILQYHQENAFARSLVFGRKTDSSGEHRRWRVERLFAGSVTLVTWSYSGGKP
jgi:hypothetical protein